ncbi:hypothetical protein CJU89_0443 [Yarrowia sp. B02]|nr:hypothetical protein CJU89_0443 [Yarrowia sp. B02]
MDTPDVPDLLKVIFLACDKINTDAIDLKGRLATVPHTSKDYFKDSEVPTLPTQATRRQCREAFDALERYIQLIGPQVHAAYPDMEPPASAFVRSARQVEAVLESQLKDEKNTEATKLIKERLAETRIHMSDIPEALDKFLNHRNGEFSRIHQSLLHQLVANQDSETRQWFFEQHLHHFSKHMPIADKTARPELHVEQKKGNRTDRHLPLEIISLIYASADLETCVALRQVSSVWYSTFQALDTILAPKMRARNPWIEPGDADLSTWRDCVLVFVGRLKSGKWVAIDNIHKAKPVPGELADVNKVVVGFNIGQDEKLPANFTSMMGDLHCKYKPCEHLHFSVGGQDYIRNPWTLEVGEFNHEGFEHAGGNKTEQYIKARGSTRLEEAGVQVIDLASGVVTNVVPQEGWDVGGFRTGDSNIGYAYTGFLNGQFQAYFIGYHDRDIIADRHGLAINND